MRALWGVVLLVAIGPRWANAQTPDDEGGNQGGDEGGDDAVGQPSGMDGGLTGAEENPEAPVTDFDRPPAAQAQVRIDPTPVGYPIEQVLRPITLPRRMTEFSLDAPNRFGPYIQSGLLSGRHGITSRIQAGLRYGLGSFVDGVDQLGDEDPNGFYPGKTFSVEGTYQVFGWLAGQVSLPILVDPFAMGVTVGAPMQFTFFRRLQFRLLGDLVTFPITGFAPSVANPFETDALVTADELNQVNPDAEVNVNGAALWQWKPDMAIEVRTGLRSILRSDRDESDLHFTVGLLYSSTNMIDIGGRIGFADLDVPDESFGVSLLAALRI